MKPNDTPILLNQQTDPYQQAASLLERCRQVLDASPFSDEHQARLLQKRTENAWNTYQKHIPYVQGFFSHKNILLFLSELFYYGMLALFLFSELFMLKRSWILFFPLIGFALLSYLISSYLSVRLENCRTFYQAEDFLKESLQTVLKDDRLTEEQFQHFESYTSSMIHLFEQTRKLEERLTIHSTNKL